MGFLSAIFGVFRHGTSGFSEYENQVLGAIEGELIIDAAIRFRRRIESINLVQRLDGGREVNAFCMRSGRAMTDASVRLDGSSGDQKLAIIDIGGPDGTGNRCVAWMADGQFFSLEFDAPTEHASHDAVEVMSAKVLLDALRRGADS